MSARRPLPATPSFEEARRILEAVRAEWLAEARAVARGLARGGRQITINDVREVCPPPPDVDPRVCGVVFRTKEWRRLRYVESRRAVSHGRPVAAFVLRD